MPSTIATTPWSQTHEESADAFRRIVEQACGTSRADDTRWHIEAASEAEADSWWTFVRHPNWPPMAQGWKLHVSATVRSAESV
ncbi:MAG TPA: hypothetical protein VFB50_18575, partial [Chloroflexota bacterium]|nr:hypothetical protein [Chloroflexota bacterium]